MGGGGEYLIVDTATALYSLTISQLLVEYVHYIPYIHVYEYYAQVIFRLVLACMPVFSCV